MFKFYEKKESFYLNRLEYILNNQIRWFATSAK